MEDFDFIHYCSEFLKDKSLGDLVFYKDKDQSYTYKDLILSTLSQANIHSKDFSALKFKSSYQLFIHLLAGSLTKKELIIISEKSPESAVIDLKSQFQFLDVIEDSEIKLNPLLDCSNYKIDMNRVAFKILSSGTSGPSKSIGLSLNNVYYSAKSIIDFFKINSQATTFLNLPHHHIGGLMILWRAFFSQSSVTTNDTDQYDFISLVPLQLKRFLQDPKKITQLKNCQAVLIGGATLEDQLKSEAQRLQIPLYETYGMSETSSLVMLNGIPLKGQEVKLDSNNHFLIKGPTLSSTVPVDKNGFYHTKDIGLKKVNGCFEFKHRSDLLFKSAGELIDPVLIESTLITLPWIKTALVVSIKHPKWTNAGCLIYQKTDPLKTLDDIKAHLKQKLHPHHIPKYFYEAPIDLIADGMKPKRFELSNWAQEKYFNQLVHYQYIPNQFAKKFMVFFHGFMEDLTDMTPLVDKDLEVAYLFVDLPGHGKTKTSNFKDREEVFLILKNLIQFYQKDRDLLLYGYSMGGRIALELSVLYLKPKTLFLESAYLGLESNDLKASRLVADRKLLTSPDLDLKKFFKTWYENPIFGKYNSSLHYENDVNKKLFFDKNQWQESMEFFSPGASPLLQSEIISKVIDLNILGITGSDDKKYSQHYNQKKEKLHNFLSFEVLNAGHNPHKTHINELKMIIKNHI